MRAHEWSFRRAQGLLINYLVEEGEDEISDYGLSLWKRTLDLFKHFSFSQILGMETKNCLIVLYMYYMCIKNVIYAHLLTDLSVGMSQM